MKTDKEGSYQTSNQVMGPNADLSPEERGMHKADMNMPAGNNSDGVDDKLAPKIPAQPCKHGHKAAAPAEEANSGLPVGNDNSGMSNGHAPMIPAQPCKRGCKAATVADDSAPPAKQTKEDEASVGKLPHQQQNEGPARKKAVAAPRDPLPDCPGQNAHPAGQQAKRRTPQEVVAKQNAQRKAIKDAIRAGERAKKLLAQMNVSEDRQDDGMDAENPQCISAANWKCAYDELEGNSNGESFDFNGVELVLNSSDEEPVPKGKGVSDCENDTMR